MSAMGLAGFAEGFASAQQAKKDRAQAEKMNQQQDRMLDIMERNPGAFSGGMGLPGGAGGEYDAAAGGPGGARSYAAMPVEAAYIRDGLVKRGMSPHLADGFVMNFKDESNFNTSAVGDNGNAFGLAQWNGPRMRALYAFADEKGVSAADPDLQMDFLMQELGSSQSGAWGTIQGAKTAGEAGALIVKHFERPAKEYLDRRYAAYLGATPTYTEVAKAAPAKAEATAADVATAKGYGPSFAGVPDDILRFGIGAHKQGGGQVLPLAMGIGG